jgi:hypothetical protein
MLHVLFAIVRTFIYYPFDNTPRKDLPMKIPKLHSDRLNEIVNEISSIDDKIVKTFSQLNDAINKRAQEAYQDIDEVISDIREILKTNNCGKMDLVLGNRKFILHSSAKDVYIAIIGEFEEVKSSWPPKHDPKLEEAKNLKPITCKNDALENMAKVQYIEEYARFGEAMLKDFLSSYREHTGAQLRDLTLFIKKSHLESEDQK